MNDRQDASRHPANASVQNDLPRPLTSRALTLRSLPRAWKHLFIAFLLTSAVGFTLGVFFVDHTTDSRPDGIAERFRGTEAMGVPLEQLPADAELQFEKTPSELLNITHTHILALAGLFLLTGGIFLLSTGIPPFLKSFLVIEPFVSLVVTFGGMWLLRYHSPAWGWVIAASGVVMTICFYAMVVIAVWQLMHGEE